MKKKSFVFMNFYFYDEMEREKNKEMYVKRVIKKNVWTLFWRKHFKKLIIFYNNNINGMFEKT